MKLLFLALAFVAGCAAQINLPGGGSVKGVQRGAFSILVSGGGTLGSGTATITAVTTAKTIVAASAYLSVGGGIAPSCTYQLTNSTTVTANCSLQNTSGGTIVVEWQTLEFN